VRKHMRTRYLVSGLFAAALLSSTAFAQTSTAPAPAPAAAPKADVGAPKLASPHWRASKLKGVNIYNEQNDKLGDINEIILDKEGKVLGYVIGVGGFLGMGKHDILVQMDKLKFVNEPVRTSSTTSTTTGSAARPATSPSTTTSTSSTASKWYPDHAVLSGATKESLKSMAEFKFD